MGVQGAGGAAHRCARQSVCKALCRADLGGSGRIEDRRQGRGERACSQRWHHCVAAAVDAILGKGVLAGARFVQRVNTSGGTGPSGRCPSAGIEERADYTADYIIYK